MTKQDNNTLILEDKEVFVFGITVKVDELYKHLKIKGTGGYEFLLNEKFDISDEDYAKIKFLSEEMLNILRSSHINQLVKEFRADGWTDELLKQFITWED